MKNNTLTLEKFLELDFKMVVDPYENVEYGEKGYVISCPDLPGIKVFGNTLNEALEELREAKIAWYEMKEELGEEIFLPKAKSNLSGRMTLRLPIFLHEKVLEYSENNKTSLNNAISFLISKGLHAEEMNSLREEMVILSEEIKGIKKSKNLEKDNLHSITINYFDEASSKYKLGHQHPKVTKKGSENHNRLYTTEAVALWADSIN